MNIRALTMSTQFEMVVPRNNSKCAYTTVEKPQSISHRNRKAILGN